MEAMDVAMMGEEYYSDSRWFGKCLLRRQHSRVVASRTSGLGSDIWRFFGAWMLEFGGFPVGFHRGGSAWRWW